jgi:DNA-binding beta-propeller fold protein YncE
MANLSKVILVAAVAASLPVAAMADVILSSNDAHTVLLDGKQHVAPAPVGPDTVDVIDVTSYPPKITATFAAPSSVVGPPGALWISKDASWGIVASATKADPAGTDGISFDDRVSVFDLTAKPPKVTQTVTAGAGAAQVRVSPDGRLALVANRAAGTVSVFSVKDKQLTPVGTLDTGNPKSMPGGIAFIDDKTALLTRYGDNIVNVLRIDGTSVTIDKRPLTTGVAPYTIDINAAHTLAAVSNMGRSDGDADCVALIDLTAKPYRVVGIYGVPSGPEPLKFSPDGRFLAVGAQNGSIKAAGNPFHHDGGMLEMFAVSGQSLRKVAEVPVGGWAESVAFSRDGRTVLLQSMLNRTIEVFRWDGKALTRGQTMTIPGAGPAAFASAWP